VEAARQERASASPWATAERLLICVGPSPSSQRIIRTGKRMASAFGADWMAVAVDNGSDINPEARDRTAQNLQLAAQLGAETHILAGHRVADTVLEYARKQNVTKIIAGKTAQAWWKQLLRRTVVEELLARSGEIDVYVITGEHVDSKPTKPVVRRKRQIDWASLSKAAGVVAVCTALSWLSQRVLGWPEANSAMIFLAGVAVVAVRLNRLAAMLAVVASVMI